MYVRRFTASDLAAIYRVCIKTGDNGADASRLYRDPYLLGHVYAGPYPIADPRATFVVVDDRGVCGYIIATADTSGFEEWLEENWWPELRRQTQDLPEDDPGDGTHDWERIRHIRAVTSTVSDILKRYPAHLHIDLLPHVQGHGFGRQLMELLFEELRSRGIPGVHLGVGAGNPNAFGFYQRIGFQVLKKEEWGSTMGIDLESQR